MSTPNAATELLHEQIADADTQWSLGTFGGIAGFSRDRDEKVSLTQSATGASAVTARGGIAIDLPEGCRPFAFETITLAGSRCISRFRLRQAKAPTGCSRGPSRG